MGIKWVDDVGAPALVTAANIASQKSTAMVGGVSMNDIVVYGITGVGYLAAAMNWGGRYNGFVKNAAISAAPLAFDRIYNRYFTGVSRGLSRSSVSRRVSRYPAPAPESPFQGVRLV